MCACWPHWMVLREDLRSELLTSYGRGELTSYHRNLLRAVEVWRNRGVWRVPLDEAGNKPPYCGYRPSCPAARRGAADSGEDRPRLHNRCLRKANSINPRYAGTSKRPRAPPGTSGQAYPRVKLIENSRGRSFANRVLSQNRKLTPSLIIGNLHGVTICRELIHSDQIIKSEHVGTDRLWKNRTTGGFCPTTRTRPENLPACPAWGWGRALRGSQPLGALP